MSLLSARRGSLFIGPAGPKGDPGATGDTGAPGSTGSSGSNGFPLAVDATVYKNISGSWTAAILAAHAVAVALGGVGVYLKPGLYEIDTTITPTQPGFKLIGDSRDTVTIKLTSNIINGVISPSTAMSSSTMHIEGITFDINGTGFAGGNYGLFFQTFGSVLEQTKVLNCRFKNIGSSGFGILMNGSQNVLVQDCLFEGGLAVRGSFVGTAISLTACRDISIIRCSERLINLGLGIAAPYTNIKINDNDFDGCAWTGPSVLSGTASTFTSTTLADSSISNWATATANFPAGIIVRAFEERVHGTIDSTPTDRRFSLNDSVTTLTGHGILEQEFVRSPKVNPVWEANVTRDPIETHKMFVDGWRKVSDGSFGIGPEIGDTYAVYQTTLAQPSFPASATASVAYWFGMDGSAHTPAPNSRWEISPLPNYGCHVTGEGPSQADLIMTNCRGKRTFGDPFSIWCAATLIGCYSEWSTDTNFTFNADDGVLAIGCHVYMAGIEGFYTSRVTTTRTGHQMTDCTVDRWGWAGGASSANGAFRLFTPMSVVKNCRAFARSETQARVAFEVDGPDCQYLDLVAYNLAANAKDLWVYAGADNNLANTFIRGKNKVDQTIPFGLFLGSPIWDLVTTQRVNGVLAGQPGSRIVSQADGNLYVKQSGVGKTNWKVATVSDPPAWNPITLYGSGAVVSWIRVDGHVTGTSVADSVADMGLNSTTPPTASGAARPAFAADAQFNNKQTLTLTSGKEMDSTTWGTTIAANHDQTLIIVGRIQNTGGTGGFSYLVAGTSDGNSYFARANTARSYSQGNAYNEGSPAIIGNLPAIWVVVYDCTNGVTKVYENDATAPASTHGAPGSHITNWTGIGGSGASYYVEGALAEVARLNIALTPDQVYETMVDLSVLYNLSITS